MAERTYGDAVGRWAGLGPYYAMFPTEFAFEVVEQFTSPGQAVLDPFAGRGSSVFAAAVTGRSGMGIEINPVGWLYGRAKLKPARRETVLERLHEVALVADGVSGPLGISDEATEFFGLCYAPRVLRFLCTARLMLQWRRRSADATLMALLMVYLHGKREGSLSNQMRQGKAMSPGYCINWWRQNSVSPPDVDPLPFLSKRVEWRYARGTPKQCEGGMILGDSQVALGRLGRKMADSGSPGFDLLLTSPPYCGVTNYHYDQWLRLWMLGGPDAPVSREDYCEGRFVSRDAYRVLLENVFSACSRLLSDDATVYVRTDARKYTHDTTLAVLRQAFPGKAVRQETKPFMRKTQTALFGDASAKPGEVDIILS